MQPAEKIGHLASAQAASDAKIDRIGAAVSELSERLRASEVRAQQREAAYEKHFEEMWQAMSKLVEGGPKDSGRASQSSASEKQHARAQQGEAEGEHVVLLQYDGPRLAGEMNGAEAAWRSKFAPAATPTDISAPKVHPILAVKFETFSEVASYVKALQGKVHDKQGRRPRSCIRVRRRFDRRTLFVAEKRSHRCTKRSSGC